MLDKKNIFKYASIFIVGLFVVLIAVQADKSFVLDEIDFPTVSNATSQSGRPVYYHSEQSPNHVGTYHPTMYINALAAFIRTFGFSENTVRFFGVICVLLSAYLLILIYRQLSSKPRRAVELGFLAIYLLNPYTLACTTLPDIDLTVLPIFLLGFIYASIRILRSRNGLSDRSALVLGGLFALVLWTKLTTSLMLPFLLVVFAYIVSRSYKKSILFTLKVAAIGIIGFVITYFIYCKALNLSPTYTYTFLLESFAKGTSTEGPLVGAIKNLGYLGHFVFWPTIPLTVLIALSSIGLIFSSTKDDSTYLRRSVVVFALLVTLFYVALIAPFGGFFKYPFPVFGILVLSVMLYLEQFIGKKLGIRLYWLVLVVLFGYLLEKALWQDSMYFSVNSFGLMWIIPVAAIVLYLLISKTKYRAVAVSMCVLLVCFTLGFQISISRLQAVSPYPTKYLYGQTGMDEAAAYLRVHTNKDEPIWAMKDIGYYVHYKYYESYQYYFSKPLQKDLVAMLDEGKVRYYVATTGIGQDNIDYYTDIKDILNQHATPVARFGNYIIYKSNHSKE